MEWSGVMEADHYGNAYLGDANQAAEAGQKDKADRLYTKGQFWLDRYNRLVGNS